MKSNAMLGRARNHINGLFAHAEEIFSEYPEVAKRNIISARKTAMRYRLRFTKDQKMSFCKGCNSYLKKGVNSTIRVRDSRIILSCLECGFVRRFGYKK